MSVMVLTLVQEDHHALMNLVVTDVSVVLDLLDRTVLKILMNA